MTATAKLLRVTNQNQTTMFKGEIGACRGCGNEKLIVIKSKYLCERCNYERKHGGKRVFIKKVSEKQIGINSLKRKIYKEIDLERQQKCTGCGIMNKPLDKSHIIPVSFSKELETDKENITLHCRKCHIVWETHNPNLTCTLFDYEKNMEYIKKTSKEYYQKLINKIK